MKPEDLIEFVGQEYQKYDKNGMALGCMYPAYLLYPDAPRYNFPEGVNWKNEVIDHFRKYCDQIDINNIQAGDIILFNIPEGKLHAAIYIGNDRIVQAVAKRAMQINRLTFFSKKINSIFRYRGL